MLQLIDPSGLTNLKQVIKDCIATDQRILDVLRKEIEPLKRDTHMISPRGDFTSVSLVGTDGGNNQLQFDPFLIQLVRVVDSSNKEYCLEAISPTTPIQKLNERQFNPDGSPRTVLGKMMDSLDVNSLTKLSHMIRPTRQGEPVSPSWVQVYRELIEWAVLFDLLKTDFGSDTMIVCDGLLRSKVFAKEYFQKLLQKMEERITDKKNRTNRETYIAGVAKHSKVLSRYRLAMALEGVLQKDYPAYVEVPRDIEEKAYVWSEFARGDDRVGEGGEINKFVGGKMFLVKFGDSRHDPVWPVDIFVPQRKKADVILGYMLRDATNGFPVPCYPRCLQIAHENAALVDFDFDILQDCIYDGVRASLGSDVGTLDAFQLQDADPAQARYR